MPAWPRLLGADARIRAGRVDEGQDRVAEAVGELDRADRLAVALGPRHAEVAVRALGQVAALLVADEGHRPAVVAWRCRPRSPGRRRRCGRRAARRSRRTGASRSRASTAGPGAARSARRPRPATPRRAPGSAAAGGGLSSRDPNHPSRARRSRRSQPNAPAACGSGTCDLVAGCSSGGGANSAEQPASVAVSSPRGTTASMWPSRSCDSARPKSSGSVSRVVCCTTRGPANDISAPGSAMRDVAERRERGDHAARGRVRADRDERQPRVAHARRRPSRSSPSASAPGCSPACARRPTPRPTRTARRARRARSAASANFSPTTLPIEPPRKLKSITASTAERPPIIGGADDARVAEAGGQLGRGQALGVRLQVDERERVGGAQVGADLDERAGVGQLRDALARVTGSDSRTGGTRAAPPRARRRGSASGRPGRYSGCPPAFWGSGSSGPRSMSTEIWATEY